MPLHDGKVMRATSLFSTDSIISAQLDTENLIFSALEALHKHFSPTAKGRNIDLTQQSIHDLTPKLTKAIKTLDKYGITDIPAEQSRRETRAQAIAAIG